MICINACTCSRRTCKLLCSVLSLCMHKCIMRTVVHAHSRSETGQVAPVDEIIAKVAYHGLEDPHAMKISTRSSFHGSHALGLRAPPLLLRCLLTREFLSTCLLFSHDLRDSLDWGWGCVSCTLSVVQGQPGILPTGIRTTFSKAGFGDKKRS